MGACQEMSPGPAFPGGGASDVGRLRGRVEGWSLGRPRAVGLYRPNPPRARRTQALSAPYLACTLFPTPPAHLPFTNPPPAHPPFSSLLAPPFSPCKPFLSHSSPCLFLSAPLPHAVPRPFEAPSPSISPAPSSPSIPPLPHFPLVSSLLGSSPFSPNLSSLSNLSPSGTFPLPCLMSPLRVGAGGGAHPKAEPLHPREKWEASRPPAM